MKDRIRHYQLIPTYSGTLIGFIAYLFVGAVPGLLYGGYMGLAMASILFGAPVQATILAKVVTFGGMFLGLTASLFFFLVMGAFLGTAIGLPFAGVLKRLAAAQTAPSGDAVKAAK